MKRRLAGPLFGLSKRAAVFAALFFCASPIFADDVVLTSKDGGLRLSGRVLHFDGSYLQIASQHGPVSIIYDNVTCEGADCPVVGAFVPRTNLSAVPDVAEVLLPALIQRFATMSGYRSRTEQSEDGHLLMTLEDGTSTIAHFDIRPATADESFADLVAFEADIILSRRDISDVEVIMAEEARVARFGDIGQSRVIGYDALTPVVSPNRTLDSISPKDLIDVLEGRTSDWAQLGGIPGPIRIQLTDHQPNVDLAATVDLTRHSDFETAVAAVVADQNALGIVSFQKSGFAQQVDLVDACGFVASPDLAAVKTGDYPLAVPLYLYHADRRMPEIVTEFLDWLPSPQAQLVVRRSGFVDAGLLPIPLNAQGQRFVNAIQSADGAEALAEIQRLTLRLADRTRLSMSFRFEPGGVDLDASSRAQALRLVQAIENGEFDGRSLLLLGFSDGQGSDELNHSLSERRAQSVSQTLVNALEEDTLARITIETAGFGEALPVGCDDTEWGRQQNRRVELWVSD